MRSLPRRRITVMIWGWSNRILRCGRRWCEFAQPAHWVALLGHSVEDARSRGRPGAGQKLDHAESRDAVAAVLDRATLLRIELVQIGNRHCWGRARIMK